MATLDRRQFLEVAGAGLLNVAVAPAADAPNGRVRAAEDGSFTVLTGKIEEGQGALTELTMAAAEELGVPLDRVRLVMGDTDQVPNDGATAGSTTTPRTVPVVRSAAAAYKQRPVTSVKDWKVLGTPHVRLDGADIVTGSHRYPRDIVRPGMLYGRVLRAPSYGATLVSVDLAPAQKMPGVIAARDGGFVGCVAPTSFAARKALEAIAATAQWKTVEQPSSDNLFEYLKQHARDQSREGSVEQSLAAAHLRLKASYQVAYVQHAPMEPRSAVAEWQKDRVTVWTGTSNSFSVRQQVAEAVGVAPERVRIIVPHFGGGFGGKHTGEAAVEAARLAKEAGRPVAVQWTRAEEFTWAYFRPAALIEVEAGLDAAGSIAAWDFTNYNSGGSALDTPYRIPNAHVRFVSSDSPLRQSSYRCLAATANNFAREAFTDELAEAAGKDPLEFRLAHLDNERIKNVLVAAAERFRWAERRKKRRPGAGIGLACGTEKNSVVAACCEVEVDRASGVPKVIDVVEAFECGPILNPAGLRSQVEGALMMGLGPALREEMRFKAGRITNASFASYRVPRFADVPRVDLVLLDRKDLEPAGAGETPIIVIAPAIANAVFDATGQRVHTMPIRVPRG